MDFNGNEVEEGIEDLDFKSKESKEKDVQEENQMEENKSRSMWNDLQGDKIHVCILLFLYCLQGIPIGLKNAIPLLLTRRSVPYTEQAIFSIASYPWTMKVFGRKCL